MPAIDYALAVESPSTNQAEAAGLFLDTEKAVLNPNEDKIREKKYVPVNAIPDEAYALIAEWEASNLTLMVSSDRMDIDEASDSVSANMLESAQSLNVFEPPKRYGRTFWRSASRRILAMSRTQPMDDSL